jgi:type IV secretory pathway TraG/TraD family ATPase VirD4
VTTNSSLIDVRVLEGDTVAPSAGTTGAGAAFSHDLPAVVNGPSGVLRFDHQLLSHHVLFLGTIGSGKTNAMMSLLAALRRTAGPEDVFIVFDTKGDFLDKFYADGDAVISNQREPPPGSVVWNLFEDLLETDPDRSFDEITEVATTLFNEGIEAAGDNLFFAAGARDVFAATVAAIKREGGRPSNDELRRRLDGAPRKLSELIRAHEDIAGAGHYITDDRGGRAVFAWLQQTVRAALSGTFRREGDFSIRRFVREKGARAVFIEYDIAAGAVLTPTYRLLIDLALKEALGRERMTGNVYVVLDEFALLPQLQHLADGINFGRSLGLKFLVGTQNVGQVHHAYGKDTADGLLGGFGTVAAFRLTDAVSRQFVRGRFGANRKLLTTQFAVQSRGVNQQVVDGSVIEDWDLSTLPTGQAVIGLSTGAPFFYTFPFFDRD